MEEEDYATKAARAWLLQLKADRSQVVDVAGDPIADDDVVRELAQVIKSYSCDCMW